MCYYLRVLGTWRIGGLAHGHQVAIKHHRNVDSYVAFTNKSRKTPPSGRDGKFPCKKFRILFCSGSSVTYALFWYNQSTVATNSGGIGSEYGDSDSGYRLDSSIITQIFLNMPIMEYLSNPYFMLALTFAVYAICQIVQSRLHLSFLNPILISAIVIIAYLKITDVSIESYNEGGKYI